MRSSQIADNDDVSGKLSFRFVRFDREGITPPANLLLVIYPIYLGRTPLICRCLLSAGMFYPSPRMNQKLLPGEEN
ncbi:hypothetical protein CEXT_192051 [Caerostris extrusa]|uniref:Uncharacterized protein n=1 Tax=Caerostris extrusa TaxID=172846 RepID=A0AAV4RJ36_CAEEX|nr:hypothetical protein CEXT_192051 [Caerostris extrusa]